MSKQLIFPILLGAVGVTLLVMLGNWQMDRLAWKQSMLANIEARLAAPAVQLPDVLRPEQDRFLSVQVTGEMGREEIHVLSSNPATGPGFRIIAPFTLENGRRILVDRGIVATRFKDSERSLENGTLFGNLLWADDVDKYTPENDLAANIWFSRSVPSLALALDTEDVFLVLSQTTLSAGPTPVMVGLNVPNSHLEYAVTWYGFAIVWAFMTLYLLWRIKRRTV